jgi:hypothetical protein
MTTAVPASGRMILLGEALLGAVSGGVVGLWVVPAAPGDADPGAKDEGSPDDGSGEDAASAIAPGHTEFAVSQRTERVRRRDASSASCRSAGKGLLA